MHPALLNGHLMHYHLTPSPSRESWELRKADGELLAFFHNRQIAFDRASQILSLRTGLLKVHRRDGSLENEIRYTRHGKAGA
jgi:hypothetical protein